MSAEYPFVRVKLEDKQVPVQVEMEAFTPFIPLNADDSGIPGAYLNYREKPNQSAGNRVHCGLPGERCWI